MLRLLLIEEFVRRMLLSSMTFFYIWKFNHSNHYEYEIELVIALSSFISLAACFLGGWIADRFNSALFVNVSSWLFFASVMVFALDLYQASTVYFPLIAVLFGGVASCIRMLPAGKIIKNNTDEQGVYLAFSSSLYSVASISGPGLGAILVANVKEDLALLNAMLLVIGALFILMVIAKNSKQLVKDGCSDRPLNAFQEFWLGVSYLQKNKAEAWLCLTASLLNFMLFPTFILLVPTKVYQVHLLNEWSVAWIDVCFAIGLIVSAKWVNTFFIKLVGRIYTVFIGFVLALIFVVGVLAASYGLLVWLAVLAGVGLSFININARYIRMNGLPDELYSRVSNIVISVSGLCSPIGVCVFGLIKDDEGLCLILCLIVGLLMMLSLLGNKPYRALNQLDDDGYALAYRCL